MCRSKTDPNYYRCEWGAGRLAGTLVGQAAEISATAIWDDLDSPSASALERLRAAAIDQLSAAIAELTSEEQDDLQAQSPRSRRHLLCSIAAAIGDACASIAELSGELAEEIGAAVRQATGSLVLGKLASIVVKKWIPLLAPGFNDVAQLGVLADTVAVSACPSQQTKRPGDHREVVACARRLESKAVQELIGEMLNELAPA